MASSVAIGWLNQVTYATLLAGSSARNMGAENLQLDQGSADAAWQTEAGVLTAADGARLTITPANAIPWRLFGLFRTNLTAAATVTIKLYNNPATLVYSHVASAVVPGYLQAVLDAGADYSADYCVIEIDDPTNPDGFINIPLAYAGAAWIPAVGMTWTSSLVGRVHRTDEFVSRGGQEFPTPLWQQRTGELELTYISGDELWDQAGELDATSRLGGNVLVISDRTPARIGNVALFGRIAAVADFGFIAGLHDCHTWKFKVTERL